MSKKLVTAVFVSVLFFSVVQAGEPSYIAFDVIDLGVINRQADESIDWREFSHGVSINSANRVAGVSNGAHNVSFQNPVSGEIFSSYKELLQPIRYDIVNNVINLNNFVPELGYPGPAGIVLTDINSTSNIAAYAIDIETFSNATPVLVKEGRCIELFRRNPENPQVLNVRKVITFDEQGDIVEVPLAGEFISMSASSINESGQLVGHGIVVTERDEDNQPIKFVNQGFIYEPADGSVHVVGSLASEIENQDIACTVIKGIKGDVIVGTAQTMINGVRVARGFVSRLPGAQLTKVEGFGGNDVSLNAINDQGVAVGRTTDSDDARVAGQAFIYNSNDNTSTPLGFLSEKISTFYSDAFAINVHGEIVGTSRVSTLPEAYKAFLYDDGVMVDLNSKIDCDAGWVLTEARDINEQGYIVGSGTKLVEQEDGAFRGEVRAYALKPRMEAADQHCDLTASNSGGGGLGWLVLISGLAVFRKECAKH